MCIIILALKYITLLYLDRYNFLVVFLTFKKDEEIQVLVQCLEQVHVVVRNLPLGRIAVPEGRMEKTGGTRAAPGTAAVG